MKVYSYIVMAIVCAGCGVPGEADIGPSIEEEGGSIVAPVHPVQGVTVDPCSLLWCTPANQFVPVFWTPASSAVGIWQHDDQDGPDSAYLTFASQNYTTGPVGIIIPAAEAGDLITVDFRGQLAGDWLYRASVRLFFVQDVDGDQEVAASFAGAQAYYPAPGPSGVHHVSLQGLQVVGADGPFRIGIKGKTFSGTARLFGGAVLSVTHHKLQ